MPSGCSLSSVRARPRDHSLANEHFLRVKTNQAFGFRIPYGTASIKVLEAISKTTNEESVRATPF